MIFVSTKLKVYILKFNTKTWFKAITENNVEIVQRFLDKNFNVETKNETNRTALHVAAEHNALDVARILLRRTTANIEAKISDQGTPLMDAVACDHMEIVRIFLQYNANVCVQDTNEWTLMHWIANEDCLNLVDIIHHSAKHLIFMKRWNGIAPLHMVRSAGMAEKFIALGAPVDDVADEYGSTPLIEAVEQNRIKVALCLIKHGANILHQNHKKKSAFTISEQSNQTLYQLFKQIVAPPLNKQGYRTRKKSAFNDNITMALSCTQMGIDQLLIENHASRRVDLFFYTLIAYYNTKLFVEIEDTFLQHGLGTKKQNSAACHSAILTSLWDTNHTSPPATDHNFTSYRTSILNGTHFENSLNATVELDVSVNYFDTNYIEGRSATHLKMRVIALAILNKVSRGELDPIEGMNCFLSKMHKNFMSIQSDYFNNKELKSSPKLSRQAIFTAQYKGTFFNSCAFQTIENAPDDIILKDDYVNMLLASSKEERINLNRNPTNFFGSKEKRRMAFKCIKQEMNLPVQYH